MYATYGASLRARWEVIWVHRGRLVRHDYGDDFSEALRIYGLAQQSGRKAATLRCKNMGFPPPKNLRPRKVWVAERVRGRKRKVAKLYVPLKGHNVKGVFWCPYCMKLRRFVLKKRITLPSGNTIEEPRFCCPVCYIGHRDHSVRVWNPLIAKIAFEIEAKGTRRSRKEPGTRTRRRRRR